MSDLSAMSDKELIEIGEGADPGYWYCPKCVEWVHSQQASFEETHDREGCGEKLIAYPDYFSELLRRFKAQGEEGINLKKCLYDYTFFLFTHVLGRVGDNDKDIGELLGIEKRAWDLLKFYPAEEAQKVKP